MSDVSQEPEYVSPNQDEDEQQFQESMNRSFPRLDNSKNSNKTLLACPTCACNHNHNNTATATATPTSTPCSPNKRLSSEPDFVPKSRNPLLDSDNRRCSLSGFSKLSLPPLQRSVSDPITPPRSNLSGNEKAVEDALLSKGTVSGSALPPKAPPLRRSISDPIPSPVNSISRSSSSNELGLGLVKDESPNAKRLKRMKEGLKAMSQWWEEALREDEDVCTCDAVKEEGQLDCEEAVRVEKTGECLDIQFKCPCGKGYQILLSGQSCYYKLI